MPYDCKMHIRPRVRPTQMCFSAQICSPEQNMNHFSLWDWHVSLHELTNSTCPGNPSIFKLLLAKDDEKGEALWGKAGRGCRYMQMNHVPPSLNPSSECLCSRCYPKCKCCGVWEARASSPLLHSGCIHIAWRHNSLPSLGLSVRMRYFSGQFGFISFTFVFMTRIQWGQQLFLKKLASPSSFLLSAIEMGTQTKQSLSHFAGITSALSIWFHFLFPESWKTIYFHFNLY